MCRIFAHVYVFCIWYLQIAIYVQMYCTYKLTDEKQTKYDNSGNYYQTVKYNKNTLSFTLR